MAHKTPSFAEDFSRLMNDAAELAGGFKREAETMLKFQAERAMTRLDMVTREEFEAVREMAIRAREENEQLLQKLNQLESKLAQQG